MTYFPLCIVYFAMPIRLIDKTAWMYWSLLQLFTPYSVSLIIVTFSPISFKHASTVKFLTDYVKNMSFPLTSKCQRKIGKKSDLVPLILVSSVPASFIKFWIWSWWWLDIQNNIQQVLVCLNNISMMICKQSRLADSWY